MEIPDLILVQLVELSSAYGATVTLAVMMGIVLLFGHVHGSHCSNTNSGTNICSYRDGNWSEWCALGHDFHHWRIDRIHQPSAWPEFVHLRQ